MKTTLKYIFPVLLLVLSCEPKEENPVPQDAASRIEAAWKCTENSSIFDKAVKSVYTVEIVKDSVNENTIEIFNFYQLGQNKFVEAELNGMKILISNQLVDGNTINGTGLIYDNYQQIDMEYYVDDGSGTSIDTCTAIYTPL